MAWRGLELDAETVDTVERSCILEVIAQPAFTKSDAKASIQAAMPWKVLTSI